MHSIRVLRSHSFVFNSLRIVYVETFELWLIERINNRNENKERKKKLLEVEIEVRKIHNLRLRCQLVI